MPKLWAETVETHRQEVREAIQDATVALVSEQGLRAVTMSQIAEETGIGRATLYKYFPDVEAILQTWHERQIGGHLEHLIQVRDSAHTPFQRLRVVLESYAAIVHGSRTHKDSELAALLHRDGHVHAAERHLRKMVKELLATAAESGEVRSDVPPLELATFCIHALNAASSIPHQTAVNRLVQVIVDGLAPPKKPHKKPTR
jgi:AcrR family transcriptional regulator